MAEQVKRWKIWVCPNCGKRKGGLPGEIATPVDHALEQFVVVGEELRTLEELREGLRREIERLTESIDNCRRNAHDAEAAALSFTRSRLEQLLPSEGGESGG